ncbi:MAG: hypothetical protein NVSMB6_29530 [Burkholderiaceae bacterium]
MVACPTINNPEKQLKTITVMLVVPLIYMTVAQVADAGSPEAPNTRKDVKAETRPIAKSGAVTLLNVAAAADAADSNAPVTGKSSTEVADEARSAARTGDMTNWTPADAALKADSVGGASSTPTKKAHHHQRLNRMANTDSAATQSGVDAPRALGSQSSEIKKSMG